jgi:hypothetical protein
MMIKHCVAWKVKEDKKENCEIIKKTLEALPSKIDVVKNLEVGINVNESPRAYDIILLSQFDSLEDLETYRVHPAHQEAVKVIRARTEGVVAVDFEG